MFQSLSAVFGCYKVTCKHYISFYPNFRIYRFNQINRPDNNIHMYWTNFDSHVQQKIFEKTLIEVCSPHLYWTNFWRPTIHVQQSIFEKTYIEVDSPHFCAYFGTFCAQIGQLFEAQWVFEICLKINKSLSSKENSSECSKPHCAANNCPIWAQIVPKEA